MNIRFAAYRQALPIVIVFLLGLCLLAALPERHSGKARTLFTTITVNTTADTVAADGFCSLREAIQAANTNLAVNECPAGMAGLDTIEFNLGAGTPTINVLSPLPTISQPIVINGNTGGATRVELNGTGAGTTSNGLVIIAGNSTVRSLLINRFNNPSLLNSAGIVLDMAGSNTIQDCLLGTNASGTAALGNSIGLWIRNSSSNNLIGGTLAGQGNLISGNVATGFFISGGASNNTARGNLIGVNAAGTAALANGQQGVHVDGPTTAGNVIGGTGTNDGNVISGNTFNGVSISGGATGLRVEGNRIGTNASGTATLANNQNGVLITNASAFGGSFNTTNNTIGGTAAGARNLISGNSQNAVFITSGANNNRVEGNYIGTDVSGTLALGNSFSGVAVGNAPNNTIGGTAAGARNVISGNLDNGVIFFGTAATGNQVCGNYIGVSAAGTADLGNAAGGVRTSDAPGNTIGGTAPEAGNVISGNNVEGVRLAGALGGGNIVQGNFIGTNAAGTATIGNTREGIFIEGAPNNLIGGSTAGARNVISGNGQPGVLISFIQSTNNTVQGNFIGTDSNGAADLGNTLDGVRITADAHDNLVGGTTAAARNIISGNNSDGIEINGAAATANLVQGNYIGTNAAGTAALGNSFSGVFANGSINNVVGGTAAGAGNLISGNLTAGVAIQNSASGNQVQGNLIGTNAAGTAAIANSSQGVFISASINNLIGGTTAAARNIISGNGIGIQITGATAANNNVQGNYIGTDNTGTADLGNTTSGVSIITSAHDNVIGGTAAGAGNVVSGNNSVGIGIGFGSAANLVQGNFIGTNAAGTGAIGNSVAGLSINGANNIIGGTTAAARNIISGNGTGGGIQFSGDATTANNTVQGNYIGTDVSGTAALGNSGFGGVFLGTNAHDNLIGGTTLGTGNLIAFNNGRGVLLSTNAGIGNRILANAIYSNTDLGIDLGNNGVTPNDVGDADTGPNNLQNFPVLLSLSSGSGNTTVIAALNSTASTAFRIEFFSNPTCDAAGNGEGQVFLGFVNVTTDASGNAPINAMFPGNLTPGHVVTLTATDPANNTSEFSPCAVCSYSITPSRQPFQTVGSSANVNVTTMSGCPWTATSNAPWVTINSGASGFGNGVVAYTVAANPGPAPRVGSMTIAGQAFSVSQAAAGALVDTDFSGPFPPPGWDVADGGTGGGSASTWTNANPCNRVILPPFSGSFAIVDAGCAGPNAVLDEQLITPPFDTTGLGQVFVEFFNQFQWNSATPNNTGDVDVSTDGGATWVNVLRLQNGDDGVPTPNTKSLNITPFIAGNPANVRVRLHYYGIGAPARPNAPAGELFAYWAVDFSIYGFGITPTSQSFASSSGTGMVSVTAAASRSWTAQSNAPWLTAVTTGGTGSGSAQYNVAANLTGLPRTGTMTIAGLTFTLNQQATCPNITVNPTTLPAGRAGVAYNQTLTQTGGTGAISWNVSAGALPTGLTLTAGGVLSGTPSVFGPFNFTIRATDANSCTGERPYTLTLNPPCPTITVNPSSLANGSQGTAYSQTLTASGGSSPYSFALTTGALPNGLSLAGNGALTGTPTVNGVFNFTVTATDNTDCTGARAYTLTITASSNGLQFFPLPQPVRLLETRAGFAGCTMPGAPINANGTLTLPARTTCAGIPTNAAAVTGNITVVPSGPGFLTLFPSSATQPTVANSNFAAGEITNNVFTVGLGAGDGAFKIFSSATTDVIVDVTGYYAPPGTGGLYFHPLATPVRLLETRPSLTGCLTPGAPLAGTNNANADPNLDLLLQGRAPVAAPCNSIPATAQVLVGNATSVLPGGGGYLSI